MKNTKQIKSRSIRAAVCCAAACCALAGCGANPADDGASSASATDDLSRPLAPVLSETRGTPVERAGGTETDTSSTYSINGAAARVDTLERLEAANGGRSSGMVSVDARTRNSRAFSIDNAANAIAIRNGAQEVTIRQDNLNRIFLNGRLVADEAEATRLAFESPVLRDAPVSVLVHADRRLAALTQQPPHMGAVGRAIVRVGRVVLRGVACRLMHGTWSCPN